MVASMLPEQVDAAASHVVVDKTLYLAVARPALVLCLVEEASSEMMLTGLGEPQGGLASSDMMLAGLWQS